MDLKIRLDILLETGQVTESVYNILLDVIKKFHDNYEIELLEENGGMFITHLSAAITRMMINEPIDCLEEAIINDVIQNENYEKAKEISKMIKNISRVDFTLDEEIFIIIHICSILNN